MEQSGSSRTGRSCNPSTTSRGLVKCKTISEKKLDNGVPNFFLFFCFFLLQSLGALTGLRRQAPRSTS